jgi:hypothetical protein
MTMNHHSSNTTEIEEIEFAAAYGTAVVMTGTSRSAVRNHQPETLAGSSGTLPSRLDIAIDRHLGGTHSFPPNDTALNPVQQAARQSIPLAAANDVGKRRGKRPPLSDLNRRRKAA